MIRENFQAAATANLLQTQRRLILLHINGKSYIGSPTTPLHVTLSDFERSNSRSYVFVTYIEKERRKPYMGSTTTPFDFSLTDLEVSFKFTQILRLISLAGANVGKILALNTNSESNT